MYNSPPLNKEIAATLRNIAAVYTLQNVNRFRIIAYERAADAIDQSALEMKDIFVQGSLDAVPGIGKSLAEHLHEWFTTGKVKHFDEVLSSVPAGIFPLLDVPGFGPKKSLKLVTELQLNNPDTVIQDVLTAARSGQIDSIEGFGHKSAMDIIQRLEEYEGGIAKDVRMILPQAYDLAMHIINYLKKSSIIERVEPLGSLRRMKETIGDIDIAVASAKPDQVLDLFTTYPGTQRILEKGPATASILVAGGRHIDIMVQPLDRFGALLQHFTGSKEHNIHLRELALKKGLSLSEYGIKSASSNTVKKYTSEKDFYAAIGLQWIPPEMREDHGEIELAQKQALPKLIETSDIKGDLHIHSNYNLEPSHDLGQNSVNELLQKAKMLGYSYIGISDHNPSVGNHNEDEIITIMKKRWQTIQAIREKNTSGVELFVMLEIDIQPDGTLALPEKAFQYLDGALVSIHSRFTMNEEEMTTRILKGLSHPKARIFAHPTARTLLKRDSIRAQWDKIFSFCQTENKALEINASPFRLDLPDSLIFLARDYKLRFTIDTDAHAEDQMDMMRFGVAMARRGWVTADQILNTYSYSNFKKWLEGNG